MSRDLPLLARYAEGLFWMARYLERVENVRAPDRCNRKPSKVRAGRRRAGSR